MSEVLIYATVPDYTLEFGCQKCSQPFNHPSEQADAEVFSCSHCGKEYPAGDDSIHNQEKRLMKYCQERVIPHFPDVVEIVFSWGVCSITTPFYDRPAYRRLSNEMQNVSHVIFADLRYAFLNSSDFIETAARLIRCGRHVHDASSGLVLSPRGDVGVSELFEVLERLQANAVRSAQNKKLKDEARKNGRMLNGTAVYGFKIIRDDKSRPFLVPDWKERKLMSELIRWRDEGFTWAECVTQARVRKFKNSRADDGIYRDRTLRRMYESAKAADFAFSEG